MGIFWLLRESVSLPAWGHGHFHQPGDGRPLCLLPAYSGTWASFDSWGQEPLLPLLPAWGKEHLLAPWGKIVSASAGTCTSSGYSGTGSSLPAWGHGHAQLLGDKECSLLAASLLGNMAILRIPGDQITFPCVGTGSLRTSLGTRTFLPARGHGHLLGDRVLLWALVDMGIFWLLGDRVVFACLGKQTLFPAWGQDRPLPGTSPASLGTRSHSPAWGQDL